MEHRVRSDGSPDDYVDAAADALTIFTKHPVTQKRKHILVAPTKADHTRNIVFGEGSLVIHVFFQVFRKPYLPINLYYFFIFMKLKIFLKHCKS